MLEQTPKTFGKSNPPRFNLLAVELQMRIIALVAPRDVIALRQTCTALFAVSHDRLVWLSILQAIGTDRQLFLPESTMSKMTARELEDTACGFGRWLSLGKSRLLEGKSRVRYTYTISPPMVSQTAVNPRIRSGIPSHAAPMIYRMRLTPGGRFLVIWTGAWLSVYQITTNIRTGNQSAPPVGPVASILVNAVFCHDMLVQTAHGGEQLRIALHFMDRVGYKYNVCEVDFNADMLALKRIASTGRPRFGPLTRARGLAGDVLLIHQTGELILWNFVESTWACWRIPLPEYAFARDAENMLLTSTCVVLICIDRVAFWKIPPLHRQPSIGTPNFTYHGLDSSQVYLEPNVVCALPDPPLECSALDGWSWSAPDQWQPDQSLSSVFLGMTAITDWDHTVSVSHECPFFSDDSFIRLNPAFMRYVDNTIAQSISGLRIPLFMHREAEKPPQFCIDSFPDKVVTVPEDDGVVLSLPRHESKEKTDYVPVLIPFGKSADILPQFSAISGRIAFVRDGNEKVVEVWDLLP